MELKEIRIKAGSKTEFWSNVLRMLGVFSKQPLTDKETSLVANALAIPSDVSRPLTGQHRKDIKAAISVGENTMSMHLRNIRDKGWLEVSDYSPFLKSLVKKAGTGDFEIKLCIRITLDEQQKN